jgi:hypothetical protein
LDLGQPRISCFSLQKAGKSLFLPGGPGSSGPASGRAADRKLELRGFKMYPNPAAGLFTLEFSAKAEPGKLRTVFAA